jgi:protoporphyrinogen oxidase
LVTAALSALGLGSRAKTLADRFLYPRLGPGMMWERFAELVDKAGGQVTLNARVRRVVCEGTRISHLIVQEGGSERRIACDAVISSMPLDDLVRRLEPTSPRPVLAAARRLRHRAFAIVQLAIDRPALFAYHWIYLHDPQIKAGRIQNFGNWSADLVPSPEKSSLGIEYFCSQGDEIWTRSDDELIELACRELCTLGLAEPGWVEDGVVVRHAKAYPIYDEDYAANVRTIRQHLAKITNLQTVGRSGMHRYNNLDHSMLTGILAARNLSGAQHDLWQVNADHTDQVN